MEAYTSTLILHSFFPWIFVYLGIADVLFNGVCDEDDLPRLRQKKQHSIQNLYKYWLSKENRDFDAKNAWSKGRHT